MTLRNPSYFSLALVLLLAACGESDPSGSDNEPDVDEEEEDTEERDAGNVRDLGLPEDTGAPDVQPDITIPDIGPPDASPPDIGVPDTSGPAVCGNGVRETGEVCDGEQFLAGASCTSVGAFIGGELRCTASCTFDQSECFASVCGDGIVTAGAETCEDGVALTDTCETLGFAPGVPDATVTCITETCQIDTSACRLQYCGNSVIETGEACDGSDFTETCRSLGAFGGDLACSTDCATVDDSGCVTNICGNGTIEGDEVCDTRLLPTQCTDIVVPADRLDEVVVPGEGSGTDGSGTPTDGPIFFAGGIATCADSCGVIDTSTCIVNAADIGPDADGDLIPDADDNCVNTANPRQLDVDGDDVGNVCDDSIVYNVLVEEEGANVITTAGTADAFITTINVEVALPVTEGEVVVAFDDEGGAVLEAITLTIGATSVPIDLSGGLGGGLPIPIPIELPTDLALEVASGSFESIEETTVQGTDLEQYLDGELAGDNTPFDADFTLTTGDGTTPGVPNEVTIATSDTIIELYYDTIRVNFADGEAALGAVPIPLDLGSLLGGFPIPIPGLGDGVSAELVGMNGTFIFSFER